MQIYLIRHPRPLAMNGRCYGQLDIEAEAPHAAAQRLRQILPAETVLYASPLQRTRRLAEALHGTPRFDERLLEMHFGDWEGRCWDDIPRQEVDAWAADLLDYAPPGGESVRSMQARAIALAREIETSAPACITLVTHAGILRALAGYWLQWPLAQWSRQHFEFAGVSLLETSSAGESATLRYLNR